MSDSKIDLMNGLIKESMKSGDKTRLNTLRYIKSLLLENKTSKSPVDEMNVIISHHKKLKDSLSIYPDGSEQQNNVMAEIQIVSEFLPKPLSEEEVQALINTIKSSQDSPNMGSIMKELSPQIKGRFDGKKASEMVKASV